MLFQITFCKRNPGFMDSVRMGAAQAIDECQFQFRSTRWNCSTLENTFAKDMKLIRSHLGELASHMPGDPSVLRGRSSGPISVSSAASGMPGMGGPQGPMDLANQFLSDEPRNSRGLRDYNNNNQSPNNNNNNNNNAYSSPSSGSPSSQNSARISSINNMNRSNSYNPYGAVATSSAFGNNSQRTVRRGRRLSRKGWKVFLLKLIFSCI